MNTPRNNPKYPQAGFFSRLKNSFFGVVNSSHKNIPLTSAISTSWAHTHKIMMVRICLLFVMLFVGYEAIFEYAKLQQANAANNELVKEYSQTVVTLIKRHNQIDDSLANTNVTLATKDSIQLATIQRLSSYAANGSISEFASYADLIAWLKQDDTHEQLYSPSFECVDFAFMMSEHAIKNGYCIFPAVDLDDGHMQCIAPIGQDLYAIEPQTNIVSLWALHPNP